MNNDIIENESGLFQAQQTRYAPSTFAFTALAVLFVLYQFIGGGITYFLLGGTITAENVTATRLATMISQILFLMVPTIYLAKRQHGRIAESFRWRVPSFVETVLALAGMIVLMQISETYLFFQNKIPLPEQVVPYIEAIKRAIEAAFKILISAQSVPELIFVLFVAAVTPAVCEELMFRGLIQKNLSLAYGRRKGFILAGTIFALYHLNPFWIVPLIALGVYFSFLRHRSQTLLLPIAAHFINNSAATISSYFIGNTESAAPTMFLGTENEPSMTIVLGSGIIFTIVFFLIIVQYIKVTENVQNEIHHNEHSQ